MRRSSGVLRLVTTAVAVFTCAAATSVVSADASARAEAAATAAPDDDPAAIAAEFPAAADPSRIIPVNGDLAEVVYALGLGDSVVATDISATYPDAAATTPKIGYQRTLNAESVLSYEPTVVIADDRAGPPEVFELLRAAGVEVVVIPFRADIQAPAYKVRSVAASLGVPDEGERLVAAFEADLAAAEAVVADGATDGATDRPSVMSLYVRGSSVQLVFGDGSGIDAVVEAAGGSDAGTALGVNGNAELSSEAIVEAAPDYFLVTTAGLESVGGVDGLLEVPGLAETPAGRNRAVLVFEDQYLYGLGPRTGQLVHDLATALAADKPGAATDPSESDATTSDALPSTLSPVPSSLASTPPSTTGDRP